MNTRTRSMIALTAMAGLALTACGGNWSQSEVEEELANELDDQYPQDVPHEVTCPGDLEVEEGEGMTCDLTDASGSGSIMVEIVSVDGNEFEYEANVGSDYTLNDG